MYWLFITAQSGVFFRAETVRHALDVLAIACVIPKVQLLFCERVDLPEESITYGKSYCCSGVFSIFTVIIL